MENLPAEVCRRLLLSSQGLCDDIDGKASDAALMGLIERLGYVQVDSINVVARAQHLTLFSRLAGYRPSQLQRLLEKERALFEHWTHDASLIPTRWFPYWRHRFAHYDQRVRRNKWWRERLGENSEAVMAHVLERIRREGPLRSSDFQTELLPPSGGRGGQQREGGDAWWSWKPEKAALEHLWRSGRLAVRGRSGFQKVYDLTERVFPEALARPSVSAAEYVAWTCRAALERLGVASAAELSAFWHAVSTSQARSWGEAAADRGQVLRVMAQGKPAYALVDWKDRVREVPDTLRLLCPFDPILRDRERLERVFGFNYRFEAFVPPPKRQYGYYVLPMLLGERLVGRLDAKLHRSLGTLEVKGLWWERGVRQSKRLTAKLESALQRLAAFVGAEAVTRLRD